MASTPLSLKVKEGQVVAVEVTGDTLTFHLDDGRSISAPIDWYPRLVFASPEERDEVEIIGNGEGVNWPLLDEYIPLRALFAGGPSPEGRASLARWKEEMKRRRGEGALREPWGEVLPLPDWWDESDDGASHQSSGTSEN